LQRSVVRASDCWRDLFQSVTLQGRLVQAGRLRLRIAAAIAISGCWVVISGSVLVMALTAVRIIH
jgi:hypothetical protein